ncbi:MAG: hypothetical protein D6695_07440 [Planctomycetota bacterium]|nr:MAG: hypothetical protein D6695_07440 [Planctomycetota bacterium]
MLRRAVRSMLSIDDVVMVNSLAELNAHPDAALALINRVLDGQFGTDSGIELIRSLTRRGVSMKLMLVSNYPEAQAEAVQAGALPGFGKAEVQSEQTRLRLLAAFERGSVDDSQPDQG